MEKSSKIRLSGTISSVTSTYDGKYRFRLTNTDVYPASDRVSFKLSKEKTEELIHPRGDLSVGDRIRVSGRVRPSNPHKLLHVKIISIEGVVLSTYLFNQKIKKNANASQPTMHSMLESHSEKVANVKAKTPHRDVTHFSSAESAFEQGMYIIRRQLRLKNPKLSKEELLKLRDAMNALKIFKEF